VRVREALTIRAAPEKVAALYLDYEHWPRLFPATIRGVRLVRERAGEITVEVDHRTEGGVVNIIRPESATVIALHELKPRFSATFINRFDASAAGTRYTVDADVRLRGIYALVAPFIGGIIRRRIRELVLEPMRAAAERGAAERPAPRSRAAVRAQSRREPTR
jgi:hypothetical protein